MGAPPGANPAGGEPWFQNLLIIQQTAHAGWEPDRMGTLVSAFALPRGKLALPDVSLRACRALLLARAETKAPIWRGSHPVVASCWTRG